MSIRYLDELRNPGQLGPTGLVTTPFEDYPNIELGQRTRLVTQLMLTPLLGTYTRLVQHQAGRRLFDLAVGIFMCGLT